MSIQQRARLKARALKEHQRLVTLSSRRAWLLPFQGPPRPFPGRRRMILALDALARANMLNTVERLSFGLQGTVDAHLRAATLLRRLRATGAYDLADVWEPCVRAARRKSPLKTRPFDCLIGESAACPYCQLEAQLRLAQWMATEPRLLAEPRLAVTISRLDWRREAGMLAFDLDAARREVRDVLNHCGARAAVFGRFEFSILVPVEAARMWEPHLHLTIAGPDAIRVKEALLKEFQEIDNRTVVGVNINTPLGWASYINKGVGTRRLPFINHNTGRVSTRSAALTRAEDVELARFLFNKTIYDLLFRWGIDLPRGMMETQPSSGI